MLTFVWNPHGFQVVDAMPCHAMPKGEMFTVTYYIQNILIKIIAQREVERGERRLVMHLDNTRPHMTK
jgi:hypothetical protein